MSITLRLALASVLAGGAMGGIVWLAAVAAGRTVRLPYWLGGTGWGILTAGLLLTDCLHHIGSGPVSEAAFPLYFGGLLAWPVALAWRQPRWLMRWLLAQAALLLTLGPAFLVAVAAALCGLR